MSEGYLPGRLRIAAGTVNFNDSRVLASCLNDGADEIERLIARVRELEEALGVCVAVYEDVCSDLEKSKERRDALRALLARGGK